MKRKKTVLYISIILVLLFASSTMAQPVMKADATRGADNQLSNMTHWYDLGDKFEIGIIYDRNNALTNGTAASIYYSLNLMTPNVKSLPVSDFNQLELAFDLHDLDIAIWVFPSTYQSLQMTGPSQEARSISWSKISDLVEDQDETHHIFGMGNSKQILKLTNFAAYVHGTGSQKEDAKNLYIYAMWKLADVLEQNFENKAPLLAEDVRYATLQYFSNNFNDLISRNIKPSAPMGSEDPSTVQSRKDRFYAEHPPYVKHIPREGAVIDPETGREVDAYTGEPIDYGIGLFSQDQITPTDFILQLLPEDSGLRGPMGEVVDVLLNFLLDQVGGLIGLDGDTVSNIISVLLGIPDFIGALSDPSASKFKDFLNQVKPLIPIPAKYLDYVDLLIDGLFLLRGDFSDIQNFIQSMIQKVVPDLGGSVDLANTLSQIFNLGSTAVASIVDGDNIMDVIFSVLNEQIVYDLVNDTLGSTYAGALDTIVSTSSSVINLLTSGNWTKLIETYGPQLLSILPGVSGLSSTEQQAIMSVIAIVLGTTGIIEDINLEEMLIDALDRLFPTVDVANIKSTVEEIVKKVGAWVENPPSLSTITSEINTLLTDLLGSAASTYTNAISAVEEVIALVISLKSDFTLSGAATVGTVVTHLLAQYGIISSSTQNYVKDVISGIMAAVAFIRNPPNFDDIIDDFKDSISSIGDNLQGALKYVLTIIFEQLGIGTSSLAASSLNVERNVQTDALTSGAEAVVDGISQAVALIFEVIGNSGNNAYEGILMTLLQAGAYAVYQMTGVDVQAYIELAEGIFGSLIGYTNSPPTLEQVLTDVLAYVPSTYQDEAETIVSLVLGLRDVFTGGFKAIFGKITEWIAGQVTQLVLELTGGITSALAQESWSLLELELPLEIGPFSLFTITLRLGLKPGFEFNEKVFADLIYDLVFNGLNLFSGDMTPGDILKKSLSFFSITPIFTAELELSDFGSGESSFISFMLEALGVQLSFSGSGFFELSLFSFKNGVLSTDDFFKILAWGFTFTITISRTFTLLDFLTGGAGGSLNAIGKYIGLDAISITIAFTIAIEIIKRAATANRPETGSLTITLGISFTVSLGIDILIAVLKLTGTLAITLTLLQDLIEPVPMRVFIAIELIITVTIGFLFWDWDFEYRWSPDGFEPPLGYELTPNTPEDAVKEGAVGGDFDEDGLSNKYESETAGLNPDLADTDGDGLDDKFETQTLNTDPSQKDTDGDGLSDFVEFNLKTDPLNVDSDFDGLNDYEENAILGTDPLAFDTDEDGLDDYYEVNHAYNMTGITPSVKAIKIGGKTYNDRTDPLNPDTDGDGLIDGEEGERGIYYGPSLANNTDDVDYTPDSPPIIFNGGYTHPLDNDTDDDSYEQDLAGNITARHRFLRDMSDYTEVHGIEVVFIDPETGEPETPRIVRTNPVNPDSDGDTGISPGDRENPPFGFFLYSDGQELALDPPSDPLDGDTDDDGLMDGLEGIQRPDSNHTDVNNPDTDGDGLGDMQELQLGTNPRNVDTDFDGVTDGDEYFIYGTSPFLADHDSDGLSDGEELFTYHSSPFHRDTDKDGIPDFDEVWKYFSDPADEDSDNDGLTDYEEIFIHYTDPFTTDTDGDGLFDGDEVLGLNYTVEDENGTEYTVTVYTDPTNPDTDGDGLLTKDQNGNPSQRMNDGDEYLLYNTRPDRMDTDRDGIKDGWELWLGKGLIPDMDPIHIDPLNRDSDGDGIIDGEELVIANTSTLLYPYIGFYIQQPYGTLPNTNDTDGDTLPDKFELDIGTLPNSNDTDNDTISDNAEYYIYETNPSNNDTDGDGINDPDEVFGYYFPESHPDFDNNATLVLTDPLDPDSDDDLLPDGAEIWDYGYDPREDDQDANGVVDGMDIDSDGDGLFDGEEFYVYYTAGAAEGGGPFQPDSDRDGILDGLEVYEVGTNVTLWDTDNDTYSDGLEYACGTDPLDNSTTLDEFSDCISDAKPMVIISPVNREYGTNGIPVVVYDRSNSTTAMEFHYREIDSSNWSSSVEMEVDTSRSEGYWKSPDGFKFPKANASYELEVIGTNPNGTRRDTVEFSISFSPDRLEILSPEEGEYLFGEDQDIMLPISVDAGSSYTGASYHIHFDNGTLFQSNTTLSREPGRGGVFYKPIQTFPTDVDESHTFIFTLFAERDTGLIEEKQVEFTITVKSRSFLEELQRNAPAVAAGALVGTVSAAAIITRFKNPFSK